jgi:hypothetical protein
MQKQIICGIMLLTLALCGCDQQAMIQKFVLPAEDKAGRTYFEDLRSGNFGPVQTATNPALQNAMTSEVFRNMQAVFGPKPVKSIIVVGAHINESKIVGGANVTVNALTYQYDMGDHFVIAQIVLQDMGGAVQINGIHVQALTHSLDEINAFTLSGKNPLFFVFQALVVLIPIFVVVTAVVCWRTPIPRLKWLWRIFVLLGITGLTLNWTDGNVQFAPIHVNLLGAAFTQQPYSPWMLEIGIPLGAILFWIKRRKWLTQAEDAAAGPS